MISETNKKKKLKKNNYKYQNWSGTEIFFLPKSTEIFFFFSFLRCVPAGHLTTAHNPLPRLEGDPTPRRREPPQPEPMACRADSHGRFGDPRPRLPVWRWPTAKAAAWGCHAGSLPVWRWPTAKPAAWGCRAHRNEFCSGVVSQSRLFTGLLKFLHVWLLLWEINLGGSWLFLVGSSDKKVIFNRIEIKIKSTVGVVVLKKNRELLKSVILEIKIEIKR